MEYPQFLGNTIKFDLFKKPPLKEYALKHKLATSCGYSFENSEYCPCCGLSVSKISLPLSIKILDLAFLGQGVPLFFNQMILVIVIYSLMLACFMVPNIVFNVLGNDCISKDNYAYVLWQQQGCEQNCPLEHEDFNYFTKIFSDCSQICHHYTKVCLRSQMSQLSFINKQAESQQKVIQSSILLCSVIIMKISMVLIREKQKRVEFAIDKELLSPSDFTAILNHLPKNNYDEKELKHALEEYCKQFDPDNNYEVVKVNIAYDISQFIDKGREKLKLEKQLQQSKTKNREKLINQIKEISQLQQIIEYEIENGCYRQTTPIAFITFQTKKQLKSLLEQTKLSYWEAFMIAVKSLIKKKDSKGFYFKGELIYINRAPEPDDVFWENCGVDQNTQLKRKILSWFVILFLLGFSLGILYGLNAFQNSFLQSDNNQFLVTTMVSFSKSLIIALVEGLIYYFITLLANQERHVTKTHQDTSIAQKLSYVQFVNSCLLLMIINIIGAYNPQLKYQPNQLSNLAVQQQGGIADDFLYVSGTNAILIPLSLYFNPLYLLKKIRQLRIEKNKDLDQYQANKLFEGPQVEFYDQYSYLCKTTWLTFFFAPLIPISILFGQVGLVSYYWIEKYLLLRRNSKPPFQSSHLDSEMLYLIDLSPILFATMQFWVDFVFNSSKLCQSLNLASIVLAGLEIIVPTYRIHRMLFKDLNEEEDSVRYEDVYLKLPTDYDRTNPLTQQNAISEFVRNKVKRQTSPLRMQLSQNLGNSRQRKNQALQDLIYKGVCEPKKIRMKILKQKLQLVLKMRRFIRPSMLQEGQKEMNLDGLEKVDSLRSSYQNSPTYLKTPEYNFYSFVHTKPRLRTILRKNETMDINSISSQNQSAYLNTPQYYFGSKKNSSCAQRQNNKRLTQS
ncbi:unnamed protein product (macronuclear) [Paramecium tetraurelia]|uniref:Anoctamin transmembrane domain-containing protein n=1 Tax=Paramecium tetraurelia TaxID=5888 RepID=A0DKV5_PARTE|nr:uncharacterized protein GSPATT00017989001 [Paramecium tetraurelia]CAK83672.1 unnamed protein product [Paramecium tetraurelia]|eukprot:XP_001451069.1 hypothetical protein (macronuclear) [Paramecium tetraurelia strain d4-2]